MLWQIIVFGLLAFIGADVLGCLFDGGRIVSTTGIGGRPSLRLRSFTEKHTFGNFARALIIGGIAGFAHYIPRTTESPWWGFVFFVAAILLLLWSTVWFLHRVRRFSELFWFAVLATAIILAAQSAVHVMALWWEARVLSWIFFVTPWMLFAFLVGVAAFVTATRLYGRTHAGIWQVVAIILAILTIVSLVVIPVNGAQIAGLPKASGSVASNSSGGSNSSELVNKLTVKLTAAQLEQLTVEKYKGVSEVLLTSSLSPHDHSRTAKTGISDALTYGFSSKKTSEMFKELETEILRNPVYGVTVANAIRDKKIGDTRIGEFNGWLDGMAKKNDSNGVSYWCEYRNGDRSTIYVSTEYRRYAATLCTFLERLIDQGVQARQTVENWPLNSSAANNDRAGVKASYQYKKDALILAYVTKDQLDSKNPVGFVIGFNIHDKRPEFYGKEDIPDIVKETPPTPSNPPGGTNPPGETTPPGGTNPPDETVPPGTGSPDPTNPTNPYNKDPSLSDNSGKNDDPGPGPDTNNGEGAQYSAKDSDSNSDHLTPTEYEKAIEDLTVINDDQKTGNDDSNPSYDGGGAAVDNNGADANKPSPQKPKEPELSGDSGNQYWDGSGI